MELVSCMYDAFLSLSAPDSFIEPPPTRRVKGRMGKRKGKRRKGGGEGNARTVEFSSAALLTDAHDESPVI